MKTVAYKVSSIITPKTIQSVGTGLSGMFKLSACMAAMMIVSACGGGSSSSEPTSTTTTGTSGSGGGNSGTTNLTGIAPVSDLSGFLSVGGDAHGFSVNIRAFDEDSNSPVVLNSLNEQTIRISSTTGEVSTFRISQAGSPSCNSSTSGQTSEAMMLFDRSGSIRDNDPSGEILEAGIAFGNLLAAPDSAAVAAFSTVINDDVEFLTGGFTSDPDSVLTAIRSIRSPDGGTPLWTSMVKSIESGGFPNTAQNKALITFSDGENTESGSSFAVLRAANANNVKLYSVSVNNRNSGELDRLSFATDGLAWSTNDATRVASFSRSLSNVLDGNFIDCSVGIDVQATAENFEQSDLIIGPARFFKPELSFGYNLGNDSGNAVNSIIFPFSAGRKMGSTDRADFGTADVRQGGSGNCVSLLQQCSSAGGARFTNNCSAPVSAHICPENGTCVTKLLPAATDEPRFGVIFENITGNYSSAVCASTDYANFQAVAFDGSSPNFNARRSGYLEGFNCLYTERMPAPDRPNEFFTTDRSCRAN